MSPWGILHVDLADGPRELPAFDRPQLIVYWWRGSPLGSRAVSQAELPVRREQMLALAAEMIAEQALSRGEHFDGLPRAGVDAASRPALTRAAAAQATGLLRRLDQLEEAPPADPRRLSVVICTRDRPAMLAACLDSLASQASPPGQIVVVDNSAQASAADVCRDRRLVTYAHEPRPGLSRARNAGIALVRGEIVAFTDDDVEFPRRWTQELVRAFFDPRIEAVTGLVAPARMDTPAQRAFQLDLGGFTSRYTPLVFDASFLEATHAMGPQVWRIGAGANMAFRRTVFARLGGFDERLGAGASGCSEDSEYWYRILAAGGTCYYEPRVVVFHHHRADWRGLRRQLRAYMQGHVAALVAQADRYGHRGNIRRIFKQLPAYFVRIAIFSLQNVRWRRLGLLAEEVLGWLLGLQYLARPRWRARGRNSPQADSAARTGGEAVSHA